MNNLKRKTIGILIFGLVSGSAFAADSDKKAENAAKLDFSIKGMTIIGGDDNGYDPNDGTSYLFSAKFLTPSWNNLKLGVGVYSAGDLFNLTDFDTERVARGMFVTDDGSEKTQLGQVYLDYNPEKLRLFGGRMDYKTPLTTNTSSTMPNFHNVFGASTTALPNTKLGIAQITKMSFGARSMTDFGLIGEGTKSAGAAIKTSLLGQAEFHDISETTLGVGAPDTDGITVLSAEYNGIKNLKLAAWDYYVDDIANNVYLQADKVIPLKGKKIKLSGQYLTQSDTGDKLAGDLDFNMIGLKAAIGSKKWGVFAALNKSYGDTAMLNAWGGDPGYTSSIFSRNEYREDVTAIKIGGKYKIRPNWTLSGGYTDYGQSNTVAPAKVIGVAPTGLVNPRTDATELDIALTWKPTKKLMLKVFHANRTSEYDGSNGKDLTQAHTRLIANYNF